MVRLDSNLARQATTNDKSSSALSDALAAGVTRVPFEEVELGDLAVLLGIVGRKTIGDDDPQKLQTRHSAQFHVLVLEVVRDVPNDDFLCGGAEIVVGTINQQAEQNFEW
jgi:hypothetical protein